MKMKEPDGLPSVSIDSSAYPAPAGSEHAMIVVAAARTIAEMEAAGARPLGMIRMLHDDRREDVLFVHSSMHQFGLLFDEHGYSRAIYLTEEGRKPGIQVFADPPATELEAFQRAITRPANESVRRGTQELGIKYARFHGIEGLEVHNPEMGLSACFAFDKAGRLWGLWQGFDGVGTTRWLTAMIPELDKAGRL